MDVKKFDILSAEEAVAIKGGGEVELPEGRDMAIAGEAGAEVELK